MSPFEIGCIGITVFLLVLAELMIRGLVKSLASPWEPFSDRMKRFSFRLYHRSEGLWDFSVYMLYAFSGVFLILGLPIHSDYVTIPAWILIFAGLIRKGRSRDFIKQMYSQVKRTMRWEEIELYQHLIKTENPHFLDIFDSPLRLEDLERAAMKAKEVPEFDSEKKGEFVSLDEAELKLREHLKELLSDASSLRCTIEDIYVILFMLSEDSRFKGVAGRILSNPGNLQSYTE